MSNNQVCGVGREKVVVLMYVHSVRLINFKSIGNYDESETILEPDITALIGKNESGKSNIIDGLSRINFQGMNIADFSDEVLNRNALMGTKIEYIVTLKPTKSELDLGISGDTTAVITSNGCQISGGLLTYFAKDLYSSFYTLTSAFNIHGSNPFNLRGAEYGGYKVAIDILNQKIILTCLQSKKLYGN